MQEVLLLRTRCITVTSSRKLMIPRLTPEIRHSTLAALSAAVILLLLTPIALFCAQPNYVVVADVHGDFDDFVALLQKTGVIDQDHHWHGGDTTFVQLGDLLDRGPKPRQAIDLMITLEPEAEKAGGHVAALLGNHEVMNIMGDLRYVTPANYASFAVADSETRRQKAWQDYSQWRAGHSDLLAVLPGSFNPTEADWMAQHPAGFVEQREAYAPDGKYGKWLRSHSVVAKLGDVVFLHGGLDANMAGLGLDTINARFHDEIKSYDATRQYLTDKKLILPFFTEQEMVAVVKAELHLESSQPIPPEQKLQTRIAPFLKFESWVSTAPDSPLWFRGYDAWTEEEGTAQITKILQLVGAKAVVVGHTVQSGGRIRSRFGGKVFLIDTGMLSSYYPGGKASALELRADGEIAAEYLDQRTVLQPASAAAPKDASGISGKN